MVHPYQPVPPAPHTRSALDIPDRSGRVPRMVEAVAGGWLLVTPLLWPHTEASAVNSWVVGGTIGVIAIYAMYRPRVRIMNLLIALWLAASTFVLPHESAATVANDLVVALVVFTASLFGGRGGPPLR